MIRLALALSLLSLTTSFAEDPAPKPAGAATDPLIEKFRQDPNDAEALDAYLTAKIQSINDVLGSDIDAVEKRTAELKEAMADLAPTKFDAKVHVSRGNGAVRAFE